MVSAEMLARLEARCRQLIMDLSATKYAKKGDRRVAPFGGLNVIFSGDLRQLPPPRGTFLGQIPWQLVTGISSKKLPLSLQGQQLVWASSTQGGVQGVTELTGCERTQDVWLQELQAELRHGRLSEDNHAFLHSKPTKVCGSWSTTTAQASCGQTTCQRLSKYGSTPTTIQALECATCRTERASRQLVAIGPNDPRFNEFELARALFHTNGVKCHANKQRAERCARTRKQCLYIMLSPWIEFRRRPFTRSPTSRKTSCDVVATQRCRLWQSVWRPAAVPGHACASTGASPSRKLQDFARMPRRRVWLVCTLL